MGISRIGGMSGVPDFAAMHQRLAEKAFDAADQDGSGTITKDEFVRSSPGRPATSGKREGLDAASAFARADSNGDASLSKDEFVSGAAKEPAAGDARPGGQKSKPAGGPPPGRGTPPAAGASSGAGDASGATSSSATESAAETEPADANGDGKVTYAEQLAYDQKQAMEAYQQATERGGAQSGEISISA